MAGNPESASGGPVVAAVSLSATHTMRKASRGTIRLLAGLGVEGDAHLGETVKHRSRVRRNADQPNLRQVHLIHEELLGELAKRGFVLEPGEMGENITTRGLALLDLPAGTRLRFGGGALLEVTGLRNPCTQLDGLAPGLMAAVLDRAPDGSLIRKAGIMAIVVEGGEIRPGDAIAVELPAGPRVALQPV